MSNPFEVLEARLSMIENLLLDIKHQPQGDHVGQSKEILTVPEAAAFLDIEIPTVYSKCSRGELPHSKRGNRLYFNREELIEYIRAGRKPTNAEIEASAHHNLKK